MDPRRWTFVVIEKGGNSWRRFPFSRTAAQVAIGGALLLVALFSSVGTGVLLKAEDALQHYLLARHNRQLETELASVKSRLETLQASLIDLEKKDDFYRLLAGLEPLPLDMRKVGIGGPGVELEDRPLLGVQVGLAGRVHEASEELGGMMRRARMLTFSWREAQDTLQTKLARLEATPSIYPTDGYISSEYSATRWHPLLSRSRPHTGVDIVAPRGTPIVAAARGRVRSVGLQGEYGLTIEIDHGWGTMTRYAHMLKSGVRVGQPVERGDVIGQVGASGLALGPHVHYEVRVNGQPVNPRRFIFELRQPE
jgi:murein DD-endopeptidase MepM/ murein hydrolase activator NlpD